MSARRKKLINLLICDNFEGIFMFLKQSWKFFTPCDHPLVSRPPPRGQCCAWGQAFVLRSKHIRPSLAFPVRVFCVILLQKRTHVEFAKGIGSQVEVTTRHEQQSVYMGLWSCLCFWRLCMGGIGVRNLPELGCLWSLGTLGYRYVPSPAGHTQRWRWMMTPTLNARMGLGAIPVWGRSAWAWAWARWVGRALRSFFLQVTEIGNSDKNWNSKLAWCVLTPFPHPPSTPRNSIKYDEGEYLPAASSPPDDEQHRWQHHQQLGGRGHHVRCDERGRFGRRRHNRLLWKQNECFKQGLFPPFQEERTSPDGGGGRDFGEPLGLARLFSSLEAERQRRKRKRRAHASHERGKEQQLCGLRGVTTSGDQRCFFSGKRNECFKQEESSSSCSGRGSRHEVSREGESQTEHNATEWHRECFQQGLSSASRPRDEIQRLGKGTGPPRLRWRRWQQ